jgi:hypothetical protein
MAYHPLGALRALTEQNTARRKAVSAAAVAFALALSGGLGGCASTQEWPSLSKISDLDNVMTPEERQKALQEMQKSDQGQSGNTSGSHAKQAQ